MGNGTKAVARGEMKLDGDDLKLYLTQVEELRRAEREGKKRGLKFRLLDINEAMVVKPDGHPNHYVHWPNENVTISDCVHWCLPGPVDKDGKLLRGHLISKIMLAQTFVAEVFFL